MRQALRTLAVLVALTVVGVASLAVSELVPDERLLDNLVEGRDEGILDAQNWPRDDTNAVYDAFTDCVAITIGTDIGSDSSFVRRIAEARHLGDCWVLDQNLDRYVAGEPVESETYARYWHGSTLLTRTLIGIVGLPTLRVALGLIVLAGFVTIFSTIRDLFGRTAALVTLAPFVITTNPWDLPQSTSQATATAVGLTGAAAIGRVAAGEITAERVWFTALVAGSIFSFFDILTIVPGIWLLGAALLLAAAMSNGMRWVEAVGWSLLSAAAWMVGFLGFWAMKWVVGAIVLGPGDIWDEVSGAVEQRVAGDDSVDPGPGEALLSNLGELAVRPFAVPITILLIAAGLWTVARASRSELWHRAVLASPALVPFAWYEFAANHSKIHDWFTYRSLPLAMGVVALAMVVKLPHLESAEEHDVAAAPVPAAPLNDAAMPQAGGRSPAVRTWRSSSAR